MEISIHHTERKSVQKKHTKHYTLELELDRERESSIDGIEMES